MKRTIHTLAAITIALTTSIEASYAQPSTWIYGSQEEWEQAQSREAQARRDQKDAAFSAELKSKSTGRLNRALAKRLLKITESCGTPAVGIAASSVIESIPIVGGLAANNLADSMTGREEEFLKRTPVSTALTGSLVQWMSNTSAHILLNPDLNTWSKTASKDYGQTRRIMENTYSNLDSDCRKATREFVQIRDEIISRSKEISPTSVSTRNQIRPSGEGVHVQGNSEVVQSGSVSEAGLGK